MNGTQWMRARRVSCAICATLLMMATGAFAHHSFSGVYSTETTFTVAGTISKVEWANPHAFFYLDVADRTGKKETIKYEMHAVSYMLRNGWTKSSIKPGDKVTVTGARARRNNLQAFAFWLKFPNGRRLVVREDVDD